MLALRPNCECCDRDLAPDSAEARICTFECTFCAVCAEDVFPWSLPELRRRFRRPADPAGGEAPDLPGLDDARAARWRVPGASQ